MHCYSRISEKRKTRVKNSIEWVINKRKLYRNRGKSYVKKNFTVVAEKIREPLKKYCNIPVSTCMFQCLSGDMKDTLFLEFYGLCDYNKQNTYLFILIEKD